MSDTSEDQNITEPGRESLIYRPGKVTWTINSFILENSSKVERAFLLALILFIFGFFFWGIFTFKAIIVNASGTFMSSSPPIPVIAEKTFIVSKVYVADGQYVKKGDLLFSEKGAAFERDIDEVKSFMTKMSENLIALKKENCQMVCLSETKALIDRPLTSSQILLKDPALKQEILSLESSLKLLSTRIDEFNSLDTSLSTTKVKIHLVSKKIAEIERRNATKILNIEYEQLNHELSDLKDQVADRSNMVKMSFMSAIDGVDLVLKKLPISLELFVKHSDMVSPVSGRITFEELRGVGQNIVPGQLLMKILPDENSIVARLEVKNQEISKIRPNQVVKFEIEAYPSTEYGVQEGRIDFIPVKDASDRDPTYKVMAKLSKQNIEKDGKKFEITPGMKTTAKILIRSERTILFFLNKIFKLKSEFLGE